MNIRTEKLIPCDEWDKLVLNTYGKPYCFQQQEGCKSRGLHRFSIPDADHDAEMNDTVPEICNHETMGVKFREWLSRDPKQLLHAEDKFREEEWAIKLWWHRNFYPDFQTVANDLHAKGLIGAGDYILEIDW